MIMSMWHTAKQWLRNEFIASNAYASKENRKV